MRTSFGLIVLLVAASFARAAAVRPTATPPACAEGCEAETAEQQRIRSHLVLVEQLLRQRPVDLDDNDRAARVRGLDALRRYIEREQFPRNHLVFGRVPVFIDDEGVACAVGFLIQESGAVDLAEQLHRQQNDRWLDQMASPQLATWVETSGFSLDELRLIQPTYRYSPRHKDPLLEAASLCDRETFFRLLKASGQTPGTPTFRATLTAALRVAAPVANWDKEQPRRPGVLGGGFGRTPFKENGLPLVRELLKRGADPNDTASGGPNGQSIVFATKDPEVRALLIASGGRLSADEELLLAVEAGDLPAVTLHLERTAKGTAASATPNALCTAYQGVGYVEMSPQILRALLESRRFDLQDPCGSSQAVALRRIDVAVELLQHGLEPDTQNRFDALANILVRALEPSGEGSTAQLTTVLAALDKHRRLGPTSTTLYPPALMRTERPKALAALLKKLGAKDDPWLLNNFLARTPHLAPPDISRVRAMVEQLETPVDDAVDFAVRHGEPSLLLYLLDHGASPNSTQPCPPLAVAVEAGDEVMVQLLLARGADPLTSWDGKLQSCLSPLRTSGAAAALQPLSTLPMRPEIRALLTVRAADIRVDALKIPPFVGPPDPPSALGALLTPSPPVVESTPDPSGCAAGCSPAGAFLLLALRRRRWR